MPSGRKQDSFFAFFRNWADNAGITSSPEQRNTELSRGVTTPPVLGLGYTNTLQFGPTTVPDGRQTEVLPLGNNSALDQRHARGANGTGRWQCLGQAPADGSWIGFDYWEKILIEPSLTALGNVISDTVFAITLLNRYRRDGQTIDSIANNAGDGITLTGPAPVAPIQPLQDRVYTITVSTDGPPVIQGEIEFTTSYAVLTTTITGTRIIIWPYPPQNRIVERLEWLTDVIRTANGNEQRHAVRHDPRQKVQMEVVAQNADEINPHQNLLFDWTTRVFGLPLWWDEQSLESDIAATDTTIYVREGGTNYADFRVGGLAMVFLEYDDGTFLQETLEISSVQKSVSPESGNWSITFATAFTNAFDADFATVVPVIPAIMIDAPQQETNAPGDRSVFSATFEAIENENAWQEYIDSVTYNELDDFDGQPRLVIEDRNFVDSTLREKISQERQRIDLGGKVTQYTQEIKGRRSSSFRWVVEDDSVAWNLRALLAYLRGKWKAVWLPTWRLDFVVNTNIGLNDSTVDVDNHGFATYIDGAEQKFMGVRLEKDDGMISYHRITNTASINSTTERLTVAPVVPFAATPAQIVRADLMVLSRQNTDTVEILHNWNDAESDAVDEQVTSSFIWDVRS